MPPIVGFVGFKGGSGKTLLAFQMAERAQSAGFRVMLWDLDPEQSAMHHMAGEPRLTTHSGLLKRGVSKLRLKTN